MAIEIVPAIMSGGSGTRLWPLSTAEKPKQFHALGGEKTMIQETALRLSGAVGAVQFRAPIVIGNAAHEGLIHDQLAQIGIAPAAVALEPVGRNTAATAALAALITQEIAPKALTLLVPADHVVADSSAFRTIVAQAAAFAHERIVTFGIAPKHPETGYGYIQAGERLGEGVRAIAGFKEKPDLSTAQDYLKQGGYYWNGGIFLFAPDLLLEEFHGAAAIRDQTSAAYRAAQRAGGVIRLGADFAEVPAQPIDIAVMEKTKRGAVAECDVGWADIGSWSELWRLGAASQSDTVVQGEAALIDCEGSLIRADDGVVVAAAGLKDFIVVATKEAVLILPKSRAQDVKTLWGKVHGGT